MTGVRPGRCHTAIKTADQQAGIQIQHDAEIQPVLRSANVGDVRPFGVRGGGGEIPLQMILRSSGWDTGRLPAPASPLGHALQAGHPVAATALAWRSGVPPTSVDCRSRHRARYAVHACASPSGRSLPFAHGLLAQNPAPSSRVPTPDGAG
jgi:hypothetical protein